ncbi:MAG: hypothetical protein Q9220_006957 [cf. Caloplaca sp. 1 TL-2023]
MGKGDSGDTNVAGAALAVALAALTIAVIQIASQLFATADGYRRCQPSVMGPWAKHTRLRWKWYEMRFETLFTTPELFLLPYSNNHQHAHGTILTVCEGFNWIGHDSGVAWLSGSLLRQPTGNVCALSASLVDPDFSTGSHYEKACWTFFMHSIRENEAKSRQIKLYQGYAEYHHVMRPACRSAQRSWDFMAPELVRPLAVTYVGDIAIMVQRLGMTWQTFRPEEGEMRAEGNGHIVYSTLVRSLGPILHYVRASAGGVAADYCGKDVGGTDPFKLRLIPTREADMMRFGLLPCHVELMERDSFAIGTSDQVRTTLDILDPTGTASKKVRDDRQFEGSATFGFHDLISLAAPVLRQFGSKNICLPIPTQHPKGLTSHKEGFVIFRQRLGEYIHCVDNEPSDRILRVRHRYDFFTGNWPYWEDGLTEDFSMDKDITRFFDVVHQDWDETTTYFNRLNTAKHERIYYADLVACHIKHAVNYWNEAHGRIREGKARNHHGLRDWLAEGMHMYWDYLPSITKEMADKCRAPEALIEEAWIVLMFRAFCWSRCHYMCPLDNRYPDSTRLPSRYWNSKLPVYLG